MNSPRIEGHNKTLEKDRIDYFYRIRIFEAQSIISAATQQSQQNDLCAQQRLRSAWASAQSDQSSMSA